MKPVTRKLLRAGSWSIIVMTLNVAVTLAESLSRGMEFFGYLLAYWVMVVLSLSS